MKSFPHLPVLGGFLSLVLCATGYTQLTGGVTRLGEPTSSIFKQIEAIIKRNSHVPLRRPTFLPEEKTPIHAIPQTVSRSKYRILLATSLPCNGEPSCFYGSIEGSASPFKAIPEVKPFGVRLSGNIEGQFFHPICNPNCGEAFVWWSSGGSFYSIGIKAERMHSLVNIATSASVVLPLPPKKNP